ncbi:MAG: T9SS type A sorting domain-containing protein [Ignavibacteriaceae bacterium]|jgi:hypothetical protein|nr:T9SS type A sorting domain-containing protein [Ignavibacteriaceae bacterium]MCW8813112.1 T9SS type A sorting domain-containing protein [Chlorobium sp.]MCW8996188.1 T9SS type A sorting domain-containing protein [Psychromonas sp.]MCW8817001.1 T9SS type A sorting domain-containing protein [Ignavibacteriaceae bacterium]MCW8823728.1 T9SS type A sorting domain-containing protein [Ignavibacteriaceae bacterium]
MKTISLFFILSLSSVLAQNWQLQYDGLDDYCTVPNAEALFSNLDVFTVETWIKASDFSNGLIFLHGSSAELLFGILPDGTLTFGTAFVTSGTLVASLAGAYPADGMWHHVACVRTGTGVGQGKIYIDGVDQTDPGNNTTSPTLTFSGDLYFGVGVFLYFLNGSVDEIRIWSIVRTQTQINNNKDVQLAGNETGLIGYWQFNEDSGQTILDSQTNGTVHDGTLGADGNVNSDDPTRIQDSGLPLPVELTSFTVNVNREGDVMLNWSTATEVNNQMFEIERKDVEGSYSTIGSVEGYGTTTESQEYSYIDNTVVTGTYFYRLKQVDFGGQYEYSDEIEIEVNGPLTFTLEQNYPNPFNPSTKIKYSVPENGNVKLSVYNLVGEEVSMLVNETVDAGFYEVTFNASNLPSGTYFYSLQTGNFVETKKMILLK